MSADNQAAPQEPTPNVAVVSAASSEYLKRTCLICGCHTNQTINIYEPRSGPNIVQLIQAKFKFQPINEDKYLCFSCNNWLINWHSLQAMNSNDADSQSPSHMSSSNSLAQEQDQAAGAPRIQVSAKVRPVACVRPRLLLDYNPPLSTTSADAKQASTQSIRTAMPISYTKRSFRRGAAVLRTHKMRHNCWTRGHNIIFRQILTAVKPSLPDPKRAALSRCRICRQTAKRLRNKAKSLVKKVNQLSQTTFYSHNQSEQQKTQKYQQPRVDGKVVAMFRRLGTTLSMEQPECAWLGPPKIMSPVKQRPCWMQNLENDEILLEFRNSISEVLPNTTGSTTKRARRRLCYQISDMEEKCNMHVGNHINNEKSQVSQETGINGTDVDLKLSNFRLPQGLSITLV
ncbi:protein phyllopod [Scaptodrosophila lebanonensis]|uniref:Protein phyllopod n=1 Tax=Drosophila lebanonensis TaxID=7225 RepID=A0A6J2UJL9_DROLE|nr:protein phyllopod [Scaptodrosophila lebanonensis]